MKGTPNTMEPWELSMKDRDSYKSLCQIVKSPGLQLFLQ